MVMLLAVRKIPNARRDCYSLQLRTAAAAAAAQSITPHRRPQTVSSPNPNAPVPNSWYSTAPNHPSRAAAVVSSPPRLCRHWRVLLWRQQCWREVGPGGVRYLPYIYLALINTAAADYRQYVEDAPHFFIFSSVCVCIICVFLQRHECVRLSSRREIRRRRRRRQHWRQTQRSCLTI